MKNTGPGCPTGLRGHYPRRGPDSTETAPSAQVLLDLLGWRLGWGPLETLSYVSSAVILRPPARRSAPGPHAVDAWLVKEMLGVPARKDFSSPEKAANIKGGNNNPQMPVDTADQCQHGVIYPVFCFVTAL